METLTGNTNSYINTVSSGSLHLDPYCPDCCKHINWDAIWSAGAETVGIIVAILCISWLVIDTILAIKAFIEEEKFESVLGPDDFGLNIICIMMIALIGAAAAVAWPVALPIAMIVGVVFLLRFIVRTKKELKNERSGIDASDA